MLLVEPLVLLLAVIFCSAFEIGLIFEMQVYFSPDISVVTASNGCRSDITCIPYINSFIISFVYKLI